MKYAMLVYSTPGSHDLPPDEFATVMRDYDRAAHPRPATRRCGRGPPGDRWGGLLIEEVFREEWGRIVASLIGFLGDFDLAEEAAQEAFAIAAAHRSWRSTARWPSPRRARPTPRWRSWTRWSSPAIAICIPPVPSC